MQGILFDLDGTLLPMDNDEFTRQYFRLLAETTGYPVDQLVPALWKGVAAMVKNDGTRPNAQAFWQTFGERMGQGVYRDIPMFNRFYSTEFHQAAAYTQPNPLARQAVALARQKAEVVVLATNPLFPPSGVATRLSWVGLRPQDFDLVTDYENSSFCKPNPRYYQEIQEKLGLTGPCLMVGNDVQEDVQAASQAGMSAFLVADCLISQGEMPDCPQGSFRDMLAFLEELP